MKDKTVICTSCPLGCRVKISMKNGEISISGNRCKKGYDHALEQLRDPKRVLTTSVKVSGGEIPLVSVKTSSMVPKRLIPRIMSEIKKIKVEAPVKAGEILLRNILDTGADLVATRTVKKAK